MIEIIKVLINNLKKNLFKDISVVAFSMLNWSNFLIFHKDVKYSFIIMNCGFFCVFFPKAHAVWLLGMTYQVLLGIFLEYDIEIEQHAAKRSTLCMFSSFCEILSSI